jgi:hypothetical protein
LAPIEGDSWLVKEVFALALLRKAIFWLEFVEFFGVMFTGERRSEGGRGVREKWGWSSIEVFFLIENDGCLGYIIYGSLFKFKN